MGTPAEVLQAFWQELRGRTRVTIDHPDLPPGAKGHRRGAIQTIWRAANEAASSELAALPRKLTTWRMWPNPSGRWRNCATEPPLRPRSPTGFGNPFRTDERGGRWHELRRRFAETRALYPEGLRPTVLLSTI
nr:DNA-binding protein [Cupriavidus pinatubonensis]